MTNPCQAIDSIFEHLKSHLDSAELTRRPTQPMLKNIAARLEFREQKGTGEYVLLWSGTAQLVEPGRRPFEVIDSASCRDVAS